MTTPRALRLNASDNVIIAVDEFPAGATPLPGRHGAGTDPEGSQDGLSSDRVGAPVRKFGQIIGFASRPIAPGEWVHEHNCAVKEFARDYHFGEDARPETHLGRSKISRRSRASVDQTARSERAIIWRF